MPSPLTRGGRGELFVQTSLYTLAALIQQAAGVVLLVLLMTRLNPEDYTRFGLLTSVYALLVPLVSLNVQIAASRLFFNETTPKGRSTMLGSSLTGALVLGAIGTLAVLAVISATWPADPVTLGSASLRFAMGGTILCIILTQFGATLYRVTGDGRSFVAMTCLQGLGLIAAYVLVSPTLPGMGGLIWGYLIAQGATAIFVLHTTFSRFGPPRVSARAIKEALQFSWPTAVHVLSLWAVAASGRWIGTSSLSLASMTPYVLVTQLVAVVGAFQRALFDATIPTVAIGYASNSPDRARKVIVRTVALAVGLGLALYGTLGLVLHAFPSILPASFSPTPALLGIAACASVLDALYLRGVQILHYSSRTRRQALATVCAGAFTIVLGFALVGAYGVEGLLSAMVAGVTLQAVFSNVLAAERRVVLKVEEPGMLSATIEERKDW